MKAETVAAVNSGDRHRCLSATGRTDAWIFLLSSTNIIGCRLNSVTRQQGGRQEGSALTSRRGAYSSAPRVSTESKVHGLKTLNTRSRAITSKRGFEAEPSCPSADPSTSRDKDDPIIHPSERRHAVDAESSQPRRRPRRCLRCTGICHVTPPGNGQPRRKWPGDLSSAGVASRWLKRYSSISAKLLLRETKTAFAARGCYDERWYNDSDSDEAFQMTVR